MKHIQNPTDHLAYNINVLTLAIKSLGGTHLPMVKVLPVASILWTDSCQDPIRFHQSKLPSIHDSVRIPPFFWNLKNVD